MNEVSLKPVIDELETLFSKFNKAFFEGKLEKPVITVSPDHTRGAYVCPCCGTIIRATKEVHVLCGECEVAFEEQE